MFVFGYGMTSYISYKYNLLIKSNEDVSRETNKRQFLLDIDNEISEKYD